jgi:hypothetical protein
MFSIEDDIAISEKSINSRFITNSLKYNNSTFFSRNKQKGNASHYNHWLKNFGKWDNEKSYCINLKESEYLGFDSIMNMCVFIDGIEINEIKSFRFFYGEADLCSMNGEQLSIILNKNINYIPIQNLVMFDQIIMFFHPVRIIIESDQIFSVEIHSDVFKIPRNDVKNIFNGGYDVIVAIPHAETFSLQELLNKSTPKSKYFSLTEENGDYYLGADINLPLYSIHVRETDPAQENIDHIDLHGMDFTKGSDKFARINNFIPNNSSWHLSSYSDIYENNLVTFRDKPSGKYFLGKKKIKITTRKIDINITIIFMCQNLLGINVKKVMLSSPILVPEPQTYPLIRINDSEFCEGYWRETFPYGNLNYPEPVETNHLVDSEFMGKLVSIINSIDMILTGNSTDENDIIPFREHNGTKIKFKQIICKLCGKFVNGDEYTLKNKKFKFKFTGGLIHYYSEHNVQPSKEFKEFILEV